MKEKQPLLYRIERYTLKWYGLMKRMEKSRMPQTMHEIGIEERRPRSRPRDKWIKGIKESVKRKGENLMVLQKRDVGRQKKMNMLVLKADIAEYWTLTATIMMLVVILNGAT